MRYATFSFPSDQPTMRLGAVTGDRLVDITGLVPEGPRGAAAGTLLALIEHGPALWNRVADAAATAGPEALRFDQVRWHAPVAAPRKNVFCVGRNYAAHVREGAAAMRHDGKLPTVPVFFTKATTAVNGPYADVPLHAGTTSQLDWEVELGVIIGRRGRDISRADALGHVFGYTVINDITARDLQQQHTQWFKGKSLDGSCPMGPFVVTADEFGDPQSAHVSLRVNGVTKQDAATADMIFPVDVLIEWLSQGLTLEPGDIIATGTPEGVGMGRTPQEWLQSGDVVEAEVDRIGVIRNRILG